LSGLAGPWLHPASSTTVAAITHVPILLILVSPAPDRCRLAIDTMAA
jgi:hypothetical protein